jgi:acetyl esterase
MEQRLDPELERWLICVTPGTDPVTVREAREQTRRVNAEALSRMSESLRPAFEQDGSISTPQAELPIRVLRPASDDRPRPTIVYLHGGGWVVGDLDTHLGHARRLCVQADAVVVSVAYRLAPEHRFPAAFEDAYATVRWAAEQLDTLGGTEQLVVAGDSAGGQLAASSAIACRDDGVPLSAQLLLYPVTDVAGRYEDAEINAFYMSRHGEYQRFGLTLEAMVAFAHNYVDAENSSDWRVSPYRREDLSGVAPAVIHTSTIDVLRTEGNFYGDRLRAAGVEVISREFPSLNHSYFGLGGVSGVANAAAEQAASDLRDLLARRQSVSAAPAGSPSADGASLGTGQK